MRRRRRRLLTCSALGALVVLGVAVLAALTAASVVVGAGRFLVGLQWQYAAVVLGLAGLHYAASALAARAASGLALPFGENVLVQLAASAANRITPVGVGGAAVNARYFARRGHTPATALSSVAALTAVGALADLAALTAIVLAGRLIGLRGAGHEVGALSSGLSGFLHPLQSVWLWAAVAVVLGGAAALSPDRLLRRVRSLVAPIGLLVRHSARLAVLTLSSAATTVLLGLAFVASAAMVSGVQPAQPLGALLVGFMLANAAGAAVPMPAGIGSTEVALIAVLVTAGMPARHATGAVVAFRVITFWLPALIGLLATKHLRRSGAL